jgi:hypothetical protein
VWRTTAWFPAIPRTITVAQDDRDGHPPYPVRSSRPDVPSIPQNDHLSGGTYRTVWQAGAFSTESVNIPSAAAKQPVNSQVILHQGILTEAMSKEGIFHGEVVLISRNSIKSTDFILDWSGRICHYYPSS